MNNRSTPYTAVNSGFSQSTIAFKNAQIRMDSGSTASLGWPKAVEKLLTQGSNRHVKDADSLAEWMVKAMGSRPNFLAPKQIQDHLVELPRAVRDDFLKRSFPKSCYLLLKFNDVFSSQESGTTTPELSKQPFSSSSVESTEVCEEMENPKRKFFNYDDVKLEVESLSFTALQCLLLVAAMFFSILTDWKKFPLNMVRESVGLQLGGSGSTSKWFSELENATPEDASFCCFWERFSKRRSYEQGASSSRFAAQTAKLECFMRYFNTQSEHVWVSKTGSFISSTDSRSVTLSRGVGTVGDLWNERWWETQSKELNIPDIRGDGDVFQTAVDYVQRTHTSTVINPTDSRSETLSRGVGTVGDLQDERWWVSRSNKLTAPEICGAGDVCETAVDHVQRTHTSTVRSPIVVIADFAAPRIGGSVLRRGCSQEDILTARCPEMLIARLLCPPLEDNEALMVANARSYVTYSGYASSFRCTGDAHWEELCNILCIDAIPYGGRRWSHDSQFTWRATARELGKLYVGLSVLKSNFPENRIVFATGNWGCGAFCGDPQLKFLLQWVACSLAGIKLLYHPLGLLPPQTSKYIESIVKQHKTVGITVQMMIMELQSEVLKKDNTLRVLGESERQVFSPRRKYGWLTGFPQYVWGALIPLMKIFWRWLGLK